MSRKSAGILLLLAVMSFSLAGCFHRHPDASCLERERAYKERSDKLRQDANEKLVIGTKKDDVVHFFEEHGLPVRFERDVAQGEIFLEGCAPFGCGTDRVILGLIVKVDAAGTVNGDSRVGGIYTDCL